MSIPKRLYPLAPGAVVSDTSGSVANQGYGLHIFDNVSYDTIFAIKPSGSITRKDQTKISSASIMYVSGQYHGVANRETNAVALFNGDVFLSGCLYVAPNYNDNTYIASLIKWPSFCVSGSRLRSTPTIIQGCYGAIQPDFVDAYAFHASDRIIPYHTIATLRGVYNVLGVGNYGHANSAGTYDRSINMFGCPLNVNTLGRNVDFYVSGVRGAIRDGKPYGISMFGGDIVCSGSIYVITGNINDETSSFIVPKGYVKSFVVADFQATGTSYFLPVTHSMGSMDLIIQTYEDKSSAAVNPMRKILTSTNYVEVNTPNSITVVVGTNGRFNGRVNILAIGE